MAWLFGKHKKKRELFDYKNSPPAFGSFCFVKDQKLTIMNSHSVKIEGSQHDLIVDFEVTETFYHLEEDIKEIKYVFPSDLKFCIYNVTFYVDEKIIKPKLTQKEEAKLIYKEAVDTGLMAIYATNISDKLTEIKVGNIGPNQVCKVVINVAFTAEVITDKKFSINFPLVIYNPSGLNGFIDEISPDFSFQIQFDKKMISKVTSNVLNGKFDESNKIFSIKDRILNNEKEKWINLNFETVEKIESSVLIPFSSQVNYDSCAVTIAPTSSSLKDNLEFIFVVDISGSMKGIKIARAAECLDLFIHSIPPESYFNVYLFETTFKKLFDHSTRYNDNTAQKGLLLAKSLKTDRGRTNIYDPLHDIFSKKNEFGQRQIFIITDGKVDNREIVLQLISQNSKNNRCFTIGIGNYCDTELVKGMAKESGGSCDFVKEGDMISEKVIPQFQSSISTLLSSIEIHIEGEDSFMASPFPIPPISSNDAFVVYLRKEKVKGEKNSPFKNGILISGMCDNETVDIPIQNVKILNEEDNFDKNYSKAIPALFAFNFLKNVEQKNYVSEKEKEMAIQVSISSGVLCKFTAYIGVCECNLDYLEAQEKQLNDSSYKDYKQAKSYFNISDIDQIGDMIDEIVEIQQKYQEISDAIDSSTYHNDNDDEVQDLLQNFDVDQKIDINKVVEIKKHNDDNEKVHTNKKVDDDPIVKKISNEKFNFMSITQFQKAEGYWEDLEALNKILGIKINSIKCVKCSNRITEKNCVATILAIAALRKKSIKEKNSWMMIEQKAIKWLKKQMDGVNIEQIIIYTQKLI